MHFPIPGNQLEIVCDQAESEVVLIAPFMKEHVLLRILEGLRHHVKLTCITRWRVEEIVSGVSDISIWPLLAKRENTTLFLRSDLHAKYYRGDSVCLVGSSNLTGAALGWVNNSNLELLIELPAAMESLQTFEKIILPGCVMVDELIYQKFLQAVESLKQVSPLKSLVVLESLDFQPQSFEQTSLDIERWLPKLRHPENLFDAYIESIDNLGSASKDAAFQDLAALPVAHGFTEDAFKVCVGALLLQKPVIQKVDHFVNQPRRFGAVKAYLNTLPCSMNPDFDPEIGWQTLMRWLTYFLPNRYSITVPNYSEVFCRVGV